MSACLRVVRGPASRGVGWLVTSLAVASLILRCGDDSQDGDGGDDSHARGGESGAEDGGAPGRGGANATGGQGGTPETGGTSTGGTSTGGRGGTAGRSGGDAGEPSSGTGGEDATGGSDSGSGGGGTSGMPGGGEGGLAGEGGSGGEPGCQDPPASTFCMDDLSGVGTADFEVKFTIRAGGQAPVYAILGQRERCEHSYFWSARLLYGGLYFEVDDNDQNYTACYSPVLLNDAQIHRVVVRRTSGILSIVVDCGPPTTCAAPTDLSMPMASLGNPTNDPCIGSGTVPLEGQVRDRCVRPL